MTGDEELKDDGKIDRASGKVKDAVGGIAAKRSHRGACRPSCAATDRSHSTQSV